MKPIDASASGHVGKAHQPPDRLVGSGLNRLAHVIGEAARLREVERHVIRRPSLKCLAKPAALVDSGLDHVGVRLVEGEHDLPGVKAVVTRKAGQLVVRAGHEAIPPQTRKVGEPLDSDLVPCGRVSRLPFVAGHHVAPAWYLPQSRLLHLSPHLKYSPTDFAFTPSSTLTRCGLSASADFLSPYSLRDLSIATIRS